MSLFGGFFGGFGDDSLLNGHMQNMNRMMESFDMLSGFPGITHMPFGFPTANSLMNNFNGGGLGMAINGGNCHSYSHSTVMTMSSGPNGQPQIYQASHSTRTGPGGVKETKKSVCDSRTGTKRLAVGRHIGERGHVRERIQNVQSGEQEENEDYINLEEDDADEFNREWQVRSRDMGPHGRHALTYRDRQERRPRPISLPAITAGRSRVRPTSTVSRRLPALTYSSVEDDEINVVCERPKKRARDEEVEYISEGEQEDNRSSTKKCSKKASRNAC